MPLGPVDRFLSRLISAQRIPIIGHLVRQLLKLLGTDIPPGTLQPGNRLLTPHGAKVVVHVSCRIGSDVTLNQNVVLGRGDSWKEVSPGFDGIVLEDNVFVGAGAVVLATREPVVIGRGAIIGANSVLTHSIEPWTIWAGNPARLVGARVPL